MTAETPSAFSAENPKLQVAWDATSLKALQSCPRRYEYEIVEGFRGSSVDLEFGILAHGAVEEYYRQRLDGASRDLAQRYALQWALENSGHYRVEEDPDDPTCPPQYEWVPWGGRYEAQWRCKGETPYRNAKGNRAKCPWSHKGVWHSTEQPSVCGECGSETESARRWVPNDPKKDRYALVRLVAWYIEEQPEELEEGIRPLTLRDGTPGVELPFRLPLPWKTPADEPYLLCGYFDRLAAFGSENFVVDLKTTGGSSLARYLSGFSPNTQIDVYDLAGSLLFPDLELRGVLIDAAQLLTSGARFGKRVVYHNEAQREELWNELHYWIKKAEEYAEADHWPMNRSHCWLCPFRDVCSLPPASRQAHLEANFERRPWNPLEDR